MNMPDLQSLGDVSPRRAAKLREAGAPPGESTSAFRVSGLGFRVYRDNQGLYRDNMG